MGWSVEPPELFRLVKELSNLQNAGIRPLIGGSANKKAGCEPAFRCATCG
jgi:hypothetical protein